MIDDRKPGVQVRGGVALLMVVFILLGAFGGLLYLLSLVFS